MRSKHFQKAYDVERARIARMIRESEAGMIFYAPGHPPVYVTPDEAARIEAVLDRGLERFIREFEGLGARVAIAIVAAAFALFAVDTLAPSSVGSAAAIVLPILFVHFMWEGLLDLRYRLDRHRWCNATAARLGHRAPIPGDIAAHHRRHNLFRLASHGLILAGVSRLIWLVFVIGDMAATLDLAGLGLILVGLVVAWPARIVDSTHRRRRWFD